MPKRPPPSTCPRCQRAVEIFFVRAGHRVGKCGWCRLLIELPPASEITPPAVDVVAPKKPPRPRG